MQLQKGGVFTEIQDQPRAWKETLQMLIQRKEELAGWLKGENFGQVFFTGCAGSWPVAVSAASIAQLVSGLNTISLPSSEIMYLRRPPYDSRIKTLVVALSRTGESDDTNWAVEKIKRLHPTCKVVMIGSQEGRLGQHCDRKIILPNCLELLHAGTRSTSSQLLACMVLTAWLANKDVFVNELVRVIQLYDDADYVKKLTDQIRKLSVPKPIPLYFTFLGTGPYYGLAIEAARKMRELGAIHAEAYPTLEYRHHTFGALTKEDMVVAFVSDTMRKAELDVMGGMARLRPHRVGVVEQHDEYAKMRVDHKIELGAKVSEISRVLVMYPVIHYFSFYFSMAKGKNPDKQMHLDPLIKISDRPGV